MHLSRGMACLDVRQESDRHAEVLDTLTDFLGLGKFTEWPEEKRLGGFLGGADESLFAFCKARCPLCFADLFACSIGDGRIL